MTKVNVYVSLEESPSSGYVIVKGKMIPENQIEEEYNKLINQQFDDDVKKFGFTGKQESFEGYKLQHILVEVKFDGRKRSIDENDVMNSLNQQGLVDKVGDNIFGGYYLPEYELKEMMNSQLQRRKELIDQGEYIEIA